MWIWSIVLLVSCATQDVLRSEPLVSRAACASGVAVFGYPAFGSQDDQDIPRCGARAIHIGDACYVAWDREQTALDPPRLFECAANAPDGHVMCVEDDGARAARGRPFVDHSRWRTFWRVRLPYVPLPAEVQLGRCRAHYERWDRANLPAPRSPEVILTFWDAPQQHHSANLRFTPIDDARAVHDAMGSGFVFARVCPGDDGPVATFTSARMPPRLARQLELVFRQIFDETGYRLERCEAMTFRVDHAPAR